MKQSANFITVATADLDAVRAFYRDGFAWEPLLDVADEIIFFQIAPGLVLGFFDSTQFAKDLGIPAAPPISGMTLAHNVQSQADVRAITARAVDLGATILKQPQDGAFGGIFHALLRDPNGVVWEIAHNPYWSVDADGTVHLTAPE